MVDPAFQMEGPWRRTWLFSLTGHGTPASPLAKWCWGAAHMPVSGWGVPMADPHPPSGRELGVVMGTPHRKEPSPVVPRKHLSPSPRPSPFLAGPCRGNLCLQENSFNKRGSMSPQAPPSAGQSSRPYHFTLPEDSVLNSKHLEHKRHLGWGPYQRIKSHILCSADQLAPPTRTGRALLTDKPRSPARRPRSGSWHLEVHLPPGKTAALGLLCWFRPEKRHLTYEDALSTFERGC